LIRVRAPVADIKAKPQMDAGLTSQLLLGDEVQIIEKQDDFCLIKSVKDDYVGYVASTCLEEGKGDLTHYVCVPRTFLYREADMKMPVAAALSLGSKLTIIDFVEVRGAHYGVLGCGMAVFANHLAPINSYAADYVLVAESLERTPYLWGGVSAFGLDCSGLVQLSLGISGHQVLRDSHEQAATLGQILSPLASLQRGDLVFWQGHVAIMCDEKKLIHANGASMDVRCEAYDRAVTRIAYQYGLPTQHRRPFV